MFSQMHQGKLIISTQFQVRITLTKILTSMGLDAKHFGFHTFRRSGASLAMSRPSTSNLTGSGLRMLCIHTRSPTISNHYHVRLSTLQPLKFGFWQLFTCVLCLLCFRIRFYLLTCYE